MSGETMMGLVCDDGIWGMGADLRTGSVYQRNLPAVLVLYPQKISLHIPSI